MARRKGVSKTKNSHARKLTSGTNHPPRQQDDRLKDDPGGTSPHDMDKSGKTVAATAEIKTTTSNEKTTTVTAADSTKLLSKKVQNYKLNQLLNNNHSKNSNVEESKNQNVINSVNKSKNSKNPDIVSHRQQQHHHQQQEELNSSEKDRRDEYKSSNTSELINNTKSSNNSNNNSSNISNNNNNSSITSSSIATSSTTSSSDLKYLHKKFKRIASATLDENINNIQQPQTKPIQRTEQENVVENNSKNKFVNEFSLANLPATALNVTGVEPEKQDTGKSRNNSLSSISSSSLSSTSSLSSPFYTNKLEENTNSLTTTTIPKIKRTEEALAPSSDNYLYKNRSNSIQKRDEDNSKHFINYNGNSSQLPLKDDVSSCLVSSEVAGSKFQQSKVNQNFNLKTNCDINIPIVRNEFSSSPKTHLSPREEEEEILRRKLQLLREQDEHRKYSSMKFNTNNGSSNDRRFSLSANQQLNSINQYSSSSPSILSSVSSLTASAVSSSGSTESFREENSNANSLIYTQPEKNSSFSNYTIENNSNITGSNNVIVKKGATATTPSSLALNETSNSINSHSYNSNNSSNSNNNHKNTNISNSQLLNRVVDTGSPTKTSVITAVQNQQQKLIHQNSPLITQSKSPQQSIQALQQQSAQQQREVDQNFSGRHVCPYCNLNCTKPSVLQKHIRAHTNERPYPCDTCGFAFKTKSNYYKHCRSRSHALRIKGGEPQPDEDGSLGSDQDQDPDLSNSSSDVISRTASPMDERMSSPAVQQQHVVQPVQKFSCEKPYKPKFHNASLYAKEENQQLQQSQLKHSNSSNQFNSTISNIYSPSSHLHHYQHPSQQQHPIQSRQMTESDAQHHLFYQQQQQQQTSNTKSRIDLTPTISPVAFQNVVSSHSLSQSQTNPSSVSSHFLHHQISQQQSNHFHQSAISPPSSLLSRESTGPSSSPIFGGIPAGGPHPLNRQFLQDRISKIILENEAIVENKELLLQKKYPKISNKMKPVSSSMESCGSSSSKLAYALVNKQQQQKQQHQQQLQHQQQSHQQQQQPPQTQHHHSLSLTQPQYQAISSQRDEILVSSKNASYNNNHSNNVTNHVVNQRITHVMNASNSTSTDVSSQPLNLSKSNQDGIVSARKRSSNENTSQDITSTSGIRVTTSTPQPTKTHPQNPERSIIKHLLLNARGLGVPNGEGDDAVYICPLCNMEFHSAEDLRLHTSNYCQGGPSSAPISPVASPSHKYFRSNSINVNLPEFNNPNSLAKLARSSLFQLSRNPLSLAKLAWSQLKTKPSNLVLNQLNVNTNTTAGSSTQPSSSMSTSSSQVQQHNNNNTGDNSSSANNPSVQKLIDAPLPSPGPLLGKTPLVEAYNNTEKKSEDVIITKVHDEVRNFSKEQSPKRLKLNNYAQQSRLYEDVRLSVNENESNSFVQSTTSTASYNLQPSMTAIHLEATVSKALLQPQLNYAMCGGEVQLLDKKEDRMKRFLSSGGCVIPISECPDIETSPKMIRTPLLSGGSFTEMSPKHGQAGNRDTLQLTPSSTPKMMIPIAPLTPSLPGPNLLSAGLPVTVQHFQFPPINSITAFNPLTLPPVSVVPSTVMHGDKLIPFVPGMPGPNTLVPSSASVLSIHSSQHSLMSTTETTTSRNRSPNRKKTPSPLVHNQSNVPSINTENTGTQRFLQNQSPMQHVQSKPSARVENESISSLAAEFIGAGQRTPRSWTQPSSTAETVKKSFNFTRIADNLSPKRPSNSEKLEKPEKAEVRHFNFDNVPKLDVIAPSPPSQQISSQQQQALTPLHVDVTSSSKSKEPTENEITEARNKAKSKFLRPTSLPLKPGTFTPKRHHGITPTANTLPLISPETPRPSKACIQLYLNGHAYTYLGLKCSTKMFYCTVNCPQPSYVANLHKLSMYSVWQVCAENNPHPLGLKPKTAMSLYDSRQRSSSFSTAKMKCECAVSHSQPTVMTPFENNSGQFYHHQVKCIPATSISLTSPEDSMKSTNSAEQGNASKPSLVGGYESNEDYTYIRGRGRGKYVCSECGIRCKKPSMLKKHIRTHTDVRPYTCKHCNFSFKTKGNLTKHMQSKTHYKKCIELGINPGPPPLDGEFMETDAETDQHSTTSGSGIGGGRLSSAPGESDSDDYSDGGDGETESSDTDESKSRLPEHEAARCLLSLSMTPPNNTSSTLFQTKSQPYSGGYQQQSMKLQQQHFEFGQTSSIARGESTTQFTSSLSQANSAAAARRVISFTSPKPPFDYQKQEQYYSNPSILPKGKDEKFDEVSMKPIDLTKPRQTETPKTFDVIGDISTESGLLKSLVSNTDKVRTSSAYIHNQKLDENVLLQAYLTEQALQYRKIKQSQMNKNFSEISNTLNSIPTTANTMSMLSSPSLSASVTLVTTNATIFPKLNLGKNISAEPSLSLLRSSMPVDKTESSIYTMQINLNNKPIETLPMEIDSNSENKSSTLPHSSTTGATIHSEPNNTLKDNKFNGPNESTTEPEIKPSSSISVASKNEPELLAVNQEAISSPQRPKTSSSPLISTTGNNQLTGPGTGGAKSVASEYLKMTSAEYLKSRSNNSTTGNNHGNNTNNNNNSSSKPEESEESSSDQEMPIQDNSSGGNSLKPPADFGGILARTVIVGEDGFKSNTTEVQPMFPRVPISDDGRPICTICSKTFQKQHQLVLHMNIHYMERKFKCEPCAVSFRTQGHLQKHERSEAHKNKVMMTSTFGVPTTSNPRPFECSDCKVAFRIHGHLAKHLRSKTHVQKLECLQKLPFGTYAEIERAGISLTEIDTTDCDNSLASLKVLAQKLIEKDPSKLSSYSTPCLENSRISPDSTNNHSTGKRSEEFEISSSNTAGKNEHPINGVVLHRDGKKDRESSNPSSSGINVTLSSFQSKDSNPIQEKTSNANNNPSTVTNSTSAEETFSQAYRLQSITEGSGTKRKYDSFSSSSCSNDSLQNSINSVQQELTSSINNNEAGENGGSVEKKPRVSLSNDS